MTESESTEKTVAEAPPVAPHPAVRRELSFKGVVFVLCFSLIAGVLSSVAVNSSASGSLPGGWRWKGGPQANVDAAFADITDQPALYTFKKVDLSELEDSLHMLNATEAMLTMDYGKCLSEVRMITEDYRKTDTGCTTLEVEALLSLKQSDKVVTIASDTIAGKPLDYTGWLWRAEAYEQLKQYRKALADYQKALAMFAYTRQDLLKQLSPVYVDRIEQAVTGLVYRRMGATYERLDDCKLAATNYEKALRVAAPQLTPTLQPPVDRSALKLAQRSVTELTQAIAIRPEEDGLYLMRARAYKLLGKYKEALDDYNHVKRSGHTANFNYERAGAYYALGKYEEAARDLRKVHAEDPLYEMPHMRQKKYSIAVSPLTSMKKLKVLHRIDKMVMDNPNDPYNYLHRGVLQMAFNQYDEAGSDLQKFLAAKGDVAGVPVAKANIYLALCRGHTKRKNDYDFVLDKAIPASSRFKWWQSVMMFLADRGVSENALLAAVKGNKARAVQAHFYIGEKLLLKGFKTKAEEHFREGIALGAPVDEYYLCKLALLPQIKTFPDK